MSDNGKSGKHSGEFGVSNFLSRFLFSLFMVLVTYNPTGLSYFDWITADNTELGALHFFVGVILLIGWVILWVATWRSLETLGVVLGALVIGALVWLLVDLGLLDTGSSVTLRWIILLGLALLLGIGLSWSHIWRRLTGQLEVDED